MDFPSNIGIYLISYLVIPFTFLYNSKIFTNSSYNFDFLSKKNTDQVKGLMILTVILHHVTQRMITPGLMSPFSEVGYLAVGMFFFLSGYGLMTSRKKKNDYLKHFLSRRFSRVYLPFFVINIVTIPIWSTVLNNKYTIYNIIYYAIGIQLIDPTTWFIITIILFYICFYLVFSLFPYELAVKLLVFFSLLYSLVCFFIGKGTWWFNVSLCFPIGVYTSLNFDKIFNTFKNLNYLAALFFSIIVFSSLFLLSICIHFFVADGALLSILQIVFQMTSSIAFIILLLLLLIKVELNSRIFVFLGFISYEMYLLHMKIYTLYSNYSSVNINYNIFFYMLLVIILSFVFKYIIDWIFKFLNVLDSSANFHT